MVYDLSFLTELAQCQAAQTTMAAILAGGAKMAGGLPVGGGGAVAPVSSASRETFARAMSRRARRAATFMAASQRGRATQQKLTPERLAAMHEGRRRWVKGLKATGRKAPCGGDFTKSAKEKAERARVHEDLARKANEAMFRANPKLIAKAFDRLAEATMRLAEATHLERLARPCDFATWAKAEKKRRAMVRLYERALFAVECIPAAKQDDSGNRR